MKCVVYKTIDGRALIGSICNEQGVIIDPDIDTHLDRVVTETEELVSWRITDHTNLPGSYSVDRYDSTFKEAFTDELYGDQVDVDLPEAKLIAHRARRVKRSEEYKLVDGDIMDVAVTPVGQSKRDAIKSKYDQVQLDLENAGNVDTLKAAMVKEDLV